MIRRVATPDENGRLWEIADLRTQTARDLDAEFEARGYEVFWQQDDFGQPIAGIPAVPGIRITPESALLCSVVCACVRVISETCAQLPLHLVKNLPGGGKQRETSNPIYRLLHAAPNKRHSSFAFRELLTAWCTLYGNAYAEIVRTRGQITALIPLHPSRMSLERLENKSLRFRYTEPTGGVTYYAEEDIFHLSWMSADGLVGMMPVGLARDAIQMARACEIHGIGFFANSARPSVVLETEHSIPPEAQERLREAWERVHRGPAQAGKTAILPNGLKAHELGQSNSDQQYLELRQFQIAEIARIWRVPPHLVGDLSRATFSNIESQGLDFLNYCIMPWIRRWESAIAMSILADEPECSAEFDVRGLMRADSATRAAYYQTCMNLGIYSLNEVRDLETLPPVEGGDVRFVTLNVQTLEAALAAAKSPAPEQPAAEAPASEKSQPEKDQQQDDGKKDEEARAKSGVKLRPTAGMAAAAKKGLRLHKEGRSGDGLKPETVARANKLARREEMNRDWVVEMNAWFQRHAADKRPGWDTPGKESPGYCAYLLWGGAAGASFSARKVAELERAGEARNCGTGKGGFQPGNTCAAGGVGEKSEAGESADHENAERAAKLIDVLSKPENADGFTVDPVGFETPETGLMVSLHKEQNTFSADEIASGAADEQILAWIRESRQELDLSGNKFIGGWLDSGDGKFYLDIATRFEPSQASEVLEAARDAKQYAVFNLETKRDTWVRYEPDDPRRPDDYDTQFAKWLASRGLTENDYTYGRDSVRSIDDFLDDICRRARLFDALRRAGVAEKEIPALAERALKRYKNVQSRSHQHSSEGHRRGDSRRSQEDGGEHIGQFAVAEKVASGDNCGTGAGGFKHGNTCAKGGDGGGSKATAEKPEGQSEEESVGMPQSAENCPAPCAMLAPVEDGGVLALPTAEEDSKFWKTVDWRAVVSADEDVKDAIRAYTGEQFDSANEAAREGNLDHVLVNGDHASLDHADPDEVIENYLDPSYVPINDDDALEKIEEYGDILKLWESAEKESESLYQKAIESMKDRTPPDLLASLPETFDSSAVYVNTKPEEGDGENKTLYMPHVDNGTIEKLNVVAESIRDYQDTTETDTPALLKEDLDNLVGDHTGPSYAAKFNPNKEYISYDTALEFAFEAARESGDYENGATLSRLDEGLREIAARTDHDGPIVTWRGTGQGTYKAVARDLKPGDTFTAQGFLSTSASAKFAVDWKGSSNLKTLWRIVGKSGAPVDDISQNFGEKEVLYPHSANFRVVRVANDVTIDRSKSGGADTLIEGVQVIDLVEID